MATLLPLSWLYKLHTLHVLTGENGRNTAHLISVMHSPQQNSIDQESGGIFSMVCAYIGLWLCDLIVL